MKVGFQPWSRWLVASVIMLGLCLTVAAHVGAQARFEGDGKVLKVDEENNMLFMAHGPIEGLMPPMRHGFVVHKPEVFRTVKKGDMIHFVLEVQNDAIGITSIEQIKEKE